MHYKRLADDYCHLSRTFTLKSCQTTWQQFISTSREENLLFTEAVNLWNWHIFHNVTLLAAHLSGVQNILSDSLSRHFPRATYGNCTTRWCRASFNNRGFLLFDLFAPHKRKKCPASGHNFRVHEILVQRTEPLMYGFLPILSYHRSWGKSKKMKQ